MTSNHLVPLGFERLCTVIGPILSPNIDNVVMAGVVEVDILLVDEMLKFVVDWVVPILLPFTMLYMMTKEDDRME